MNKSHKNIVVVCGKSVFSRGKNSVLKSGLLTAFTQKIGEFVFAESKSALKPHFHNPQNHLTIHMMCEISNTLKATLLNVLHIHYDYYEVNKLIIERVEI